ncbi:hypothetical protein [Microvirga ossetica]|uniref:hypothetical protein n=1 Tax=Microvirga ossetica TaxID=1882682 RepID=UPI0012FFF65C|nr:hypothetical protein [Microvirga ossetica]
MRPHDAALTSGPLWCVPVAAGIIAVWHSLPLELELVGLEGEAGLLVPLERHRIFSPTFAKNFYTIASHGLQDGRRLRAFLRDPNGGEIERALDLKLAHWQIEGVPQIVSFIISRILPKHDAHGDHETLERFLSLVSSWRASCRLSAEIGPHALYELDVVARCFASRQTCFFTRAGKLTRETVDSFGHRDGTVFLTAKSCLERAYADLGGDLVELDFSNDPVADQDTVAWLKGLGASARNNLIDHLSAASPAGVDQIPGYVTRSLASAAIPLGEPGAALTIKSCFQTSGTLFAFLEITGTASLESLQIQAFGTAADQFLTPELLITPGANGDAPRVCLVAKGALDHPPPHACKIIAVVDGQHIAQWIHLQAGDTQSSLAFAHTFWPFADRDEHYLTQVAAPLAQAWVQRPSHEPAKVISVPRPSRNAEAIDLQIIAAPQLDLLHGTLIAVRSSIPLSHPVRVTLSASHHDEKACSKVSGWATQYGFKAQIEVIPAGAPAAMTAHPRSPGSSQAFVAVRAGFVPPQAGWLGEIAQQITQLPESLFIGVAPNRRPGPWSSDEVSLETLLDLLAHDAIVAVAGSADAHRRIVLDRPVCHTAEGRWVEWLAEGRRQGIRIAAVPGLAFWEMEPAASRDEFGPRIDEISLLQTLAAAEER